MSLRAKESILGVTIIALLVAAVTGCTGQQEQESGIASSVTQQVESSMIREESSESVREEKAAEQRMFSAPRIGTFYEVNPEGAEVAEAEDGRLFGFPEWLSDGCSSWCGCEEFSCVATASSQLSDQGKITYDPSNVVFRTGYNGDMLDTAWAEGVQGTGIGESIELCQMYRGTGEKIFTFTELCIVNGYAKNQTSWEENGRVKVFRVYYEEEYLGELTLLDTRQPQYIDLAPFQLQVANGGEATFRFEIAEVYEGSKYEDTCITGIVIDFAGRIGH